ncbi:Histone-lysine N-methyltransferase SETMAR [Eumeta japonica]|uniref:Histone-lysine N-methyltransferase SETMAR n=1 Tax=Eumeta variegata TaxID=151549 RepID=A0A4C1UL83_EUMVA|nr:Histone-lysine N-methyltransferase SETMAR [Eumeta japonica]
MKFYYKKGKNATQAAKKICDLFGPNAVSVRVGQNWLKGFQSDHFDAKVEPRSGRPVMEKLDAVLGKIEHDRHISLHEIAEELGIDHKTVVTYLKKV